MSCNHCGTKFNFFHKELGCGNCGMSFCSKCLKQKCKIPSKSPAELNVCRICYSKLASGPSVEQQDLINPPDTFLKRLETLENPAAPPIIVYKQDPKISNLKRGLTPADQQLVDRLEKLKEEREKKVIPTDNELRKRLDNLKGENNYVREPSKQQFAPDFRTEQQKVDSLLEQFANERDIELSHNPQEEIEARLATLRGQGVRPNEGLFIQNLHDSSGSEEDVDRITKKIMDEVALEERFPLPSSLPKGPSEEEDASRSSPELPWCVLCNNDAKYRCLDCSGDLYCTECNIEVHRNWGDTDHKVVPYKSQQQ